MYVVPVNIAGYLLNTDIMANFMNRYKHSEVFSNLLRHIKFITAFKSLNFELDKFDALYAKISAAAQICSYN